jgi:hypothetical protein
MRAKPGAFCEIVERLGNKAEACNDLENQSSHSRGPWVQRQQVRDVVLEALRRNVRLICLICKGGFCTRPLRVVGRPERFDRALSQLGRAAGHFKS